MGSGSYQPLPTFNRRCHAFDSEHINLENHNFARDFVKNLPE